MKEQRVTGKKAGRRAAPKELALVKQQLCHPKGDLKACLILMIARRPAHGYELLDSLKSLGYEAESPARIYRALRWLEEAGLLAPTWETGGSGPARRVYKLTDKGSEMAQSCIENLRTRSQALEQHLSTLVDRDKAGSKRQFEVLVEAKLTVVAPDAGAVQQVVQSALSDNRDLGAGVRGTGQVWIYEATEQSSTAVHA